ncbi:hypothetical protein GCM10022217_12220 [Chryseobacterium ginsenosidimutans]
MPKSRIIDQQKEKNKEQKMSQKPETVFNEKIHYKCFFKILRIVFHSFQTILYTAKIRYNESFN